MFIYSWNREYSGPSGDVNKIVFANGQTLYVIQVHIFFHRQLTSSYSNFRNIFT